jgi:hypothetical protein
MTLEELQKWQGQAAIWRPKLRSDGAISIPVTVEAVQMRYGRSECRIHPTHGTGAAWVSVDSLKLKSK